MKKTANKINEAENLRLVKTNYEISINQKEFKIDFSKVKSLEQLICILKAMNISIHSYNDKFPEQFKDLVEKGLLIELNKI